MFRYRIIVFLTGFISFSASAQQVLTEDEAVSKALANNKNIQAASLQVKQQQQLLKSAINLPNPEFFGKALQVTFIPVALRSRLNSPPCTVISTVCKSSKLVWRKKKSN